ncbi:MAG: hypothetical protein QNJ69_12830 [Gammaproteobacteria bacterium]|nr:hypothetical protein [Gammaproteobacteria bacterium]
MTDRKEVSADAERIAQEINSLVQAFRKDSRRDRKMIYSILLVMGLFMAVIGSHIWGVILTMEDDMTSMSASMLVMEEDMDTMAYDMNNMSGVMSTMSTMGDDVRLMSTNVSHMTQSVAYMSSMTPSVQSMAVDTRHMGRDIDRMMPTNWFD